MARASTVELLFWFGAFPLICLVAALYVIGMVIRADLPLEALPWWRRAIRRGFFPTVDATPEELAKMDRDAAERRAEARHRQLVSTIRNASLTGRG